MGSQFLNYSVFGLFEYKNRACLVSNRQVNYQLLQHYIQLTQHSVNLTIRLNEAPHYVN